MMADAFSMFDYGGGLGMFAYVYWLVSGFYVFSFMWFSGIWVQNSYFDLALNKLTAFFSAMVGKKGRTYFGFNLFCSSVFLYFCFLSGLSSFPYGFCLSAHFSHNFSITMIIWFSLLVLSFSTSWPCTLSHLIPSNLDWFIGVVIGLFEMVSVLSRILTLGARLTMNIIAGKVVLCIGSSFLGSLMVSSLLFSWGGACLLSVMLILVTWEFFVSLLQPFILIFLTAEYLSEAPLEL